MSSCIWSLSPTKCQHRQTVKGPSELSGRAAPQSLETQTSASMELSLSSEAGCCSGIPSGASLSGVSSPASDPDPSSPLHRCNSALCQQHFLPRTYNITPHGVLYQNERLSTSKGIGCKCGKVSCRPVSEKGGQRVASIMGLCLNA